MTSPSAALPGIVIVSPGGHRGGGGMGTVSRTILEWFSANRPAIRCTVLDSRGDGSVWRSPIYAVSALIRLVAERTKGARILHIQVSERLSFYRKAAFVALGRAMGMRIIVHHHGAEFVPELARRGPLYRLAVAYVVRSAAINIVIGDAWRQSLIADFGLTGSRLAFLRNCVDDIAAKVDRIRKAQRKDNTECRYLLLANLSPRKGVSEFLEALSAMKRSGTAISAVVAGGGDVERYRREAQLLSLGDTCRFTGWVGRDEVIELFAHSDAMVLPSYDEGMPISILESLSAGVPVVATPVGAIPELLRDDEDCLLVSPGDVAALARAMQRLAADRAMADRLSANGRKHSSVCLRSTDT